MVGATACIMTLILGVEIDHYYRPTGLPRERQPWLASVWRRSNHSF
jgi:hypothetical protein